MQRIERYVVRGVSRPVVGVFLGLLAVVLVFYASRALAQAVAQQLPISSIALFTVLRLGIFMDVLLPVALFLGIVIGLGRLQATYEVIAMAAIGTGLKRILFATLLPAVVVAVMVGAFSTAFRPWAYKTVYTTEAEFAARVDLAQIDIGRFQALNDEWLVFAEGRRNGALENVLVRQRDTLHDSLLRAPLLHLETAREGQQQLVFSGGVHLYRFGDAGTADWIGEFKQLVLTFTPPQPPTRERLRRAMPMNYLFASAAPIDKAELQWRLHSPLGVMVLALAAFPLSRINPRYGQSARVLGGTLFVTFYFSVLGVLISWVEQERIPAWPGAFWLPVGLAIGLAFQYWYAQRRPGAPL
jgi:lipopolysaccharide export system permease protein